jgi:hypothetical protein
MKSDKVDCSILIMISALPDWNNRLMFAVIVPMDLGRVYS